MSVNLSALRTGWPPYAPRKITDIFSVRGSADSRATVLPEGLGDLKYP
jgi:hypothetical protein